MLYSDRPSGNNTPVNVLSGALILKEIFWLMDKEIVETLSFDIRYQYALHATSFEEQPLNDRSLGRFRARGKNIQLVTTDLKGSEVSEHWADFESSEDGDKLLKCAAGYEPKSSVYDKNTQRCKASFPIDIYKSCPYHGKCHPVEHIRVATVKVAMRTAIYAKQQRFLETEEFRELARFRNGIETVPAALRSRHDVDKMLIRGYIKTKVFFGFKIAGMNARKLIRYMTSQVKVVFSLQTT